MKFEQDVKPQCLKMFIVYTSDEATEVYIIEDEDKSGIPPFQPIEEIDFPTVEGAVPRIPHIIHQIFTTEKIPLVYVNNIKSFMKFNQRWEYRFWTYKSGRKLLQRFHPYLIKTFDSFGESVMKADVIRVAALYEFGGLYSDLDIEFLRPLDRVTMKYACVLNVAPCEVAAYYNMSYQIVNGFMLTRPKHPFFKLLLDGFRGADPSGDPPDITGPVFLTEQYERYNKILPNTVNRHNFRFESNSPSVYHSFRRDDDEDATFIPNTQYFMDNLGPMYETAFKEMCTDEIKPTLSWFKQRGCLEFKLRKEIRQRKRYTFAVHKWTALWLKPVSEVRKMKKVHIRSIVPYSIFF